MKKLIFLFCWIIFSALTCGAADNASVMLKDAAAKLRSAKSVTAVCRISAGGSASNASLTMSSNRFVIKSPEMEVWFDGKNQWAYSPRTGEVNLTEPTREELGQVNPLSVIDYFSSDYTASMLPATKGNKNIRLTAKSVKSDISTADISLNATTLAPVQVNLRLKSGETVSIAITSLKYGAALPANVFTYHRNLHPDAEIIDLR